MKLCVSCKACKRECLLVWDMARMKVEVTAAHAAKHGMYSSLTGWLAICPPMRRWHQGSRPLPIYVVWLAVHTACVSIVSRLTGFTTKHEALPSGMPMPFVMERLAMHQPATARRLSCLPTPSTGILNGKICGQPCAFWSGLVMTSSHLLRQRDGRFVVGGPICHQAWWMQRAAKPIGLSTPFIRWPEPVCVLWGWSRPAHWRFVTKVPGLLSSEKADVVAAATLTFAELLAADEPDLGLAGGPPVKLHGHCHQKAFDAVRPIESVLRDMAGLEVETVETSCCGMAVPLDMVAIPMMFQSAWLKPHCCQPFGVQMRKPPFWLTARPVAVRSEMAQGAMPRIWRCLLTGCNRIGFAKTSLIDTHHLID